MEESERDRLEAPLEAITLAGSADLVRQEVQELRRLAVEAQAVEDAGTEAKLSELKALLRREGFSTTQTSAYSSSLSSRTRWTTSWVGSSPGVSASVASTAA